MFFFFFNSALNQFEINFISISFFKEESALFYYLNSFTNFKMFIGSYYLISFFMLDLFLNLNNIAIFTNFFFYSILSFFFFQFFFFLGTYKKKILVSNGYHIFFEKFFLILQGIVQQNFPNTFFWSQSFFPLILTLFFFIFSFNFLGLYPYSFTTTSFIFQTFILSCTVLIGVTLLSIFVQGFSKFLSSFVPKDIPKVLVPLLVVIEIISYVSRAFSLAIRLFANMMSGHTLLHILSDFAFILGKNKYIFGFFPFLIVFVIFFLEIGVAALQAYVFTILFIIYLNDSCQYDDSNFSEKFVNNQEKKNNIKNLYINF